MNPRRRAALQMLVLLATVAGLLLIFPAAFRFVEVAARELRYLWWLILFIALGCWLIWGATRRPRK